MTGFRVVAGDYEYVSNRAGAAGEDVNRLRAGGVVGDVVEGMPGSESALRIDELSAALDAGLDGLAEELFRLSAEALSAVGRIREAEGAIASGFSGVEPSPRGSSPGGVADIGAELARRLGGSDGAGVGGCVHMGVGAS